MVPHVATCLDDQDSKACLRALPMIYPDSLRPPPVLPDADRIRDMGLNLSDDESTVIRMGMAIHTAARQPKRPGAAGDTSPLLSPSVAGTPGKPPGAAPTRRIIAG